MQYKRAYHVAVSYGDGLWAWGGGSSLMERYDFGLFFFIFVFFF